MIFIEGRKWKKTQRKQPIFFSVLANNLVTVFKCCSNNFFVTSSHWDFLLEVDFYFLKLGAHTKNSEQWTSVISEEKLHILFVMSILVDQGWVRWPEKFSKVLTKVFKLYFQGMGWHLILYLTISRHKRERQTAGGVQNSRRCLLLNLFSKILSH